MKENQYECTSVPAEINIYSEFMDVLDNYENLYESKNNHIIEEENVMLPETNQRNFLAFYQNMSIFCKI